jgi:hypothetical protein
VAGQDHGNKWMEISTTHAVVFDFDGRRAGMAY